MRYSRFYIPTLREDPKDAQIASHKLMIRAGLIRKMSSGLYNWLPLGLRVFRKVENIIREEMNRAGALEFVLNILQPAELWEKSGRWQVMGKEMFRLKDRHDNWYSLGPTHEEAFTYILSLDIKSYRDLPINVYQIHTKFRDEIRPRYGVMRAREFVMKDAYSFDIDEEGLERSYQTMRETYRRIFKRCGLEVVPVEADVGAMGGSKSEEFMVPSVIGEETIIKCSKCDYVANQERAEFFLDIPEFDRSKEYPSIEEIETPNVKTIEELTNFLNERPENFIKTLIYLVDKKPYMVLIRGDRDVNEVKLKNVFGAIELELPSPEYVETILGLPVGFLGPVGIKDIPIIIDRSILTIEIGFTGANKKDYHYKNVVPGRDFLIDKTYDIATAVSGDLCPKCKGKLEEFKGIEVGHVFKLGDKYTRAFDFTVLDKDGKSVYPLMGCYGIGVDRTVATIIEQNHDDDGIIWPISVAPFHAIITTVGSGDEVVRASSDLYDLLSSKGIDVLWDDRELSPGVKFKDADLIGIPYRIVVSKKTIEKKSFEVRDRKTKEVFMMKEDELLKLLLDKIEASQDI